MPKSLRFRRARILTITTLLSAVSWAGAVRATTPSDPQLIDAYEQEVTNTGLGDVEEEVVPLDQITSRCGDGDGCRIRLTLQFGVGLADRLAAQLFSVDNTGSMWTIHDPHLQPMFIEGDVTSSGDATAVSEGLIIFFNTGAEICEFFEIAGATIEYRLGSSATSLSPTYKCRLRIDD